MSFYVRIVMVKTILSNSDFTASDDNILSLFDQTARTFYYANCLMICGFYLFYVLCCFKGLFNDRTSFEFIENVKFTRICCDDWNF